MKDTIKLAVQNRAFLIPLAAGVALLVILLALSTYNVRPTELQVPVRYSSYGITNFYREQWFYQLSFPIFGILIAVMHGLLSVRLYETKGPKFAVLFQWLTVVVLALSVVTVAAVLQVANLV
ncbi:MAG TPA: hypothetical protein VF597_01050 [Candidatus Saccharimonadales bacterium]|jgi:hypothetical protein